MPLRSPVSLLGTILKKPGSMPQIPTAQPQDTTPLPWVPRSFSLEGQCLLHTLWLVDRMSRD